MSYSRELKKWVAYLYGWLPYLYGIHSRALAPAETGLMVSNHYVRMSVLKGGRGTETSVSSQVHGCESGCSMHPITNSSSGIDIVSAHLSLRHDKLTSRCLFKSRRTAGTTDLDRLLVPAASIFGPVDHVVPEKKLNQGKDAASKIRRFLCRLDLFAYLFLFFAK